MVAQTYAKSNATIVTYGMGITQHVTGTSNVHQIASLLLLRGNIGKQGVGICPLRGHSNVQGNCTVGITEKPPAFKLEKIEKTYGFVPKTGAGMNRSGCRDPRLRHGEAIVDLRAIGGRFDVHSLFDRRYARIDES